MRIIKLTSGQLKESTGESFDYLRSDNEERPFNGQTDISVNGLPSAYDDIEVEPRTSDDEADSICRPGWYATFRGPNMGMANIRESDANTDGMDDFYEKTSGAMDNLSDNDKTDDTVYVPATIQQKCDMLIDAMRSERLNARQCAMVINKLIERLDTSKLPYSWKKALRLKIN